METQQIMKTGTTTIAIKCKDGVVLAADKRATAGYLVVNKKTEKIYIVNDDLAITMAGTVSDAQLLSKLLKAELKLKELRTGTKATVKEAANFLGGMVYSNIRRFSVIPGISHFVMGGRDETGCSIYDIFADGSVTDADDYITSGSGSVFAYGVLETLYDKGLSLQQGVSLAVKAISAALQRDIASGNGIDVVTISSAGIQRVEESTIAALLRQK
ncbi:proteasome subunit beta [Candidatus Woesearchaeota archaeon]|nr:proteasome subunit beta [Candidatus Woesearchaeota archaeon]